MTREQLEAYEDASTISSDPFDIINRNNRNHRKKQDLILEQLDAPEGGRVLEVGCGHGLHTTRYSEHFDLTAVDLSPELVRQAQSRAPEATVEQADAHNLPYADDTFEAVVGTAILHHMREQGDAIREWRRVTKPGGRVVLMEPNFLFPKDTLTTFVVPEERHKIGMAPWRLHPMLENTCGEDYQVDSCLFTPPWPARAESVFDTIDSALARVPIVREFSMMKRITIEC